MPSLPVIRVSAVVLRRPTGEVLTVRKRGTDRFMLPGGKPEPGETPAQTAVREAFEEVGAVLDESRLRELGTFRAAAANEDGQEVEGTVFEHPGVPHVAPGGEIAELRWLDPAADLPDDLAPLLQERVLPVLAGTRAWDLWFETVDGVDRYPGRPATRPRPTHEPAGWVGSAGPAIDPATWPRGTLTGLPMFHAVTLLLPPEFQRRGPELPAVAFFQGEGQFAHARRGEDDPTDPFVADLRRSREHPHLGRRVDIIDGQFALVWLTRAEYDAGPTAPPPDTRRPGEHVADDEGPNAWDEQQPTAWVWLTERPDPNAGHVPVDPMDWDGTDGFVPPPRTEDWKLVGWAEDLHLRSHLGGTSFPVQTLVEGFTPYYLELEELPGMNFGGGNAQIDLESEAFDWACG